MSEKESLRKALLTSRKASYNIEIHSKIQRNIVDFLLPSKAENIGIYCATQNEVQLLDIVSDLKERTFYLPRVREREMDFAPYEGEKSLVPGAYNILEPQGLAISPRELDLLLIPGLAFTKSGARLGYGGGFYDRFLDGLECIRVGICQHLFLVKELPTESHDIKMDYVISEEGVFTVS